MGAGIDLPQGAGKAFRISFRQPEISAELPAFEQYQPGAVLHGKVYIMHGQKYRAFPVAAEGTHRVQQQVLVVVVQGAVRFVQQA